MTLSLSFSVFHTFHPILDYASPTSRLLVFLTIMILYWENQIMAYWKTGFRDSGSVVFVKINRGKLCTRLLNEFTVHMYRCRRVLITFLH